MIRHGVIITDNFRLMNIKRDFLLERLRYFNRSTSRQCVVTSNFTKIHAHAKVHLEEPLRQLQEKFLHVVPPP